MSTYIRVNVYGRDVTLGFQNRLGRVDIVCISVCAYGGKQERCTFAMSLCALMYKL